MLHFKSVSPDLKSLIETICLNDFFSSFSLCGGTALALQIGHRVSVDADFISEFFFDKNEVAGKLLAEFPNAADIHIGEFGVFAKINDIKIDFLSWNIPFIRPVIKESGIRLLNVEEIIAMKMFAIMQRGEKKDYIDIVCMLEKYNLMQMCNFYLERHKNSDMGVLLRFLASYSDVENQPDPHMLVNFSWENCKAKLNESINAMLH